MAITATFSANFTDFFSAVEKSKTVLKGFQVDVEGVGKSLNKLGDMYLGQKIQQQAILTAKAIQDIGGVSKLTAAELQRAGVVAAQAAEKFRALGQDVPTNIQALANAARTARGEMDPLAAGMTAAGKAASDSAKMLAGMGEAGRLAASSTQAAAQQSSAAWADFVKGFDPKAAIANPAQTAAQALNALATSMGPVGVAAATTAGMLVAAGTALFELTRQAAEVGATLGDLSDKTGVTVPALSRLANAAGVAGTSVSELSDAIYKMDIQAAETPEKFADGMKKLGINTQEFLALNPEDRLTAFAGALANTDDAAVRNAAGFEVMGKQFKEMGPKLLDLAKAMELTSGITVWSKQQADDAEAFQMQVKALKLEFSDIGVAIGRDLIPAMSLLITVLKEVKTHWAVVIPEGFKLQLGLVADGARYAATAWDLFRGNLNKKLKAEGLDDTTKQTEALRDKIYDAARAPAKLREELLKTGEGAKGLTLSAADLERAWQEETRSNADATRALKETSTETTKAAAAAELIKQAYDDLASVGKSYTDTLAKLDPLTRAYALHLLEAGADAGALKVALGLTDAQMKALSETVKQVAKDTDKIKDLEFGFKGLDDQIQKVGKSARDLDVADAFTKAYDAVVKVEQGVNGLSGSLDDLGVKVKPAMTDVALTVSGAFSEGFDKLPDMLVKAFTGGGDWIGAFKAVGILIGQNLGATMTQQLELAFGKIDGAILANKIKQAVALGTAGAGALGGAIGGSSGAQIAGLASGLGGAAIAATAWGSSMAAAGVAGTIALGAVTLGVGAAAVGVVLLAKHFLTVSQAEKDARKAFEDFNKAIGGSNFQDFISRVSAAGAVMQMNGEDVRRLLEHLEQATHKSPAAVAAALKPLADLIDAAEARTKALNAALETIKGADAFKAIVGGLTDAVKGWDTLKDAVDAAAAAERAASKGGDQVGAARAARDLAAAYKAQAQAAAGAKQELADLGLIAVTQFAAAVASGQTMAQAIAAMAPGLETLRKSYDDLGLAVDDVALNTLFMQSAMLANAPQLLAAVGGLSSEMQALADLGLLNASTFAAMQRTGLQMYTRLQAAAAEAGGSTKDALLPMQQYLHQAEEAAKKLGVPLDDNTELLIEQSKELGIWQEKGKSATDVMLDGINALVDAVSKLIDQLRGIPTDITTTVHMVTQVEPGAVSGGGEVAAASRGGLVTGTGVQYLAGGGANLLPWRPRGTDTIRAMLTPGESVLTKAATARLGPAAIGRLNAGGAAPAGGATIVDLESVRQEISKLRSDQARSAAAFPKSIARAVRDEMQRLVKR